MGQYDLEPQAFKELKDKAMDEKRKVVVMFEDADGNWRGAMWRDETVVQSRAVGPETVLVELLTHDGK